MKENEEFYTFNNYLKIDGGLITASMEDYIEMIYRLSENNGFTRTGDLSKALNVKPASITKMIKKLDELNLAKYEKYGYIRLTENGSNYGAYLLNRHNTIEKFLEILGVSKCLLQETEKIEHVLSKETFERIINFIEVVEKHPEIKRLLDNNSIMER
jgi:Mn-dependent DtxR family transcriptional regulator